MAKKSGSENADVQKEIAESGATEPNAAVKTAADGHQERAEDTLPEKQAPVVKSVHTWANEKRLATWQTALLLKSSGWLGDKKVSEEDFTRALAVSLNRKQGGNNG